MLYLSPIIFFFIALLFSMLGMGGFQLFIPVLYWLGMDFKTQTIPLGMLLNVVTSSSSAVTYTIKKMIDWKVAVPFGLSMIIFASVGAWTNIRLLTKPVILIFAVFTAAAAILMLCGKKPEKGILSSSKRLAGDLCRQRFGLFCRTFVY